MRALRSSQNRLSPSHRYAAGPFLSRKRAKEYRCRFSPYHPKEKRTALPFKGWRSGEGIARVQSGNPGRIDQNL